MVSPDPISPDQSGSDPESQAVGGSSPEAPEALVLVTLKASSGTIVKIEAVEPDGSHHELAPADVARLTGDGPKSTLQSIVHEAFEAGLACVLGGGDRAIAEEAASEGKEETELHDVLLDSLIAHSAAKRLLQQDVLNSAMLGTIISEASNGAPTGSMTAGT
jgi:hypothetical protein